MRIAPFIPPAAILVAASAFALAWSAFILRFGVPGVVLGWWPAALIGGGGALAIFQAVECARRLVVVHARR